MRRFLVVSMLLVAGCGLSTEDWVRRLKDADVVKRREAVRELGLRTGEAARVVPALIEALADESGYVRRDAAIALGKFGAEAGAAVLPLVKALADKEYSVRTAAGAALKKIDPQAAKKAGVH